jgi:hypothetical protein
MQFVTAYSTPQFQLGLAKAIYSGTKPHANATVWRLAVNFCSRSSKAILVLVTALALIGFSEPIPAADAPKPLKILLLAGGCCHDYAHQKEILKKGIEARINATVDIVFVADASTTPKLPIYGNPGYAEGYDVVIHDECAADVSDPTIVEGVLQPHRDGIPAVNLHCAMHCYRIGNPNDPVKPGTPHGFWFEYLGLQSSGHGAQLPISISFSDSASPITKGLADWTTMNEELYNNVKVFDTAHALARGKQDNHTVVVAWTNLYRGKTRVFSTTIGHNNQTVADPRYLDLVTRGLLWACNKLGDDGNPLPGYAK